ncbi:basal body-orientation factor 1 isoform 2-T2 [Anomaloglossus baeobatrachus]|uniref:basal body-orientation factor 1 isoform X2 n=1 Tax=Anomaloglossus baeobatrachus TaxID=238106 RepID=UPI003F4FF9E4
MAAIRRKTTKGKKGKRKKTTGKHETLSKVDKESEVERAKASAAVWEARLKMTEFSRAEYREATRSLAHNNVELTRNQYQLEKDMLDVIGFLKKEDEKKEEMVETYEKQISCLEEECSHKAHEMQVIQSEFRMMKEFRRHKAELERELDEIKDSLLRAKKEHEKALSTAERHFIQEKQRLEKEAEKKVVLLAEEAHTEAVMQLGEVGRSVFTENVRLREAISYHMNQSHELQKTVLQLQEERKRLLQDKETNEQLIQAKIHQGAEQNSQIQALQRRIGTLEGSLETTQQKEHGLTRTQKPLQPMDSAGKVELQMLHQTLELKDREMKRVKKLAHNILQERTEVEHFFLEALEHVRQEIKSSRSYYQKVAQVAYHSHMRMAATGAEQYPKIRTFHNKKHSSNDVSRDLTTAENWSHVQSAGADFKELTWEQKEKVLRLLFAKMNASAIRKRNPIMKEESYQDDTTAHELHERSPGDVVEHGHTAFLTQPISEAFVSSIKLPNIHKTKSTAQS